MAARTARKNGAADSPVLDWAGRGDRGGMLSDWMVAEMSDPQEQERKRQLELADSFARYMNAAYEGRDDLSEEPYEDQYPEEYFEG
jgi:hypothetical protein